MKEIKPKPGLFRRLCLLLLAMLFFFGAVMIGPRAEAAEKSLTAIPGTYVCWRRGLPPQDGNWHRALIIWDDWLLASFLIHGNEVGPNQYYGNGDTAGDKLVMDNPGADLDRFPEIDLSKDSFFTDSYLMALALRYNSTAGSAGNGKEPHFGNAPYYEIALPKTDKTVDSIGFRYDPTTQIDSNGEPLYGAKITNNPTPWYFCGYEHDDSVDKGKYVIGCLRNRNNSGTNTYLTAGQDQFPPKTHKKSYSCIAQPSIWWDTVEFYIYYGEEMMIDAVADNQVIGDDEIVNVNGSSYLTLQSGSTLTVKDGGILSIGSGLFNDGTIRVEKGGTLIVKQNAFIMPWQPGNGNGNIICDGGDVIIQSGGRVVCEGASGFKFVEDGRTCGTVYNYGVIVTQALTIRGKANAFHNEGSVMLGYKVKPAEAQAFRDSAIRFSGDSAVLNGMTTGGINVDQVTAGVVTGKQVKRP